MAEPVLPESGVVARPKRWPSASGMLLVLLELALALRVLAALAVEWYVRRGGPNLCLFPDTKIYWELARAIRASAPYQIVDYRDIPHFALRTPGYPIVLAGCHALFGEQTLAVRLVQAVLGTCSVYLVYRLTCQLVNRNEPAQPQPAGPDLEPDAAGGMMAAAVRDAGRSAACRGRLVPLLAAALAAFHPYYVFMSAILLSEAVFEPLFLAALWGLAVLWPRPGRPADGGLALAHGPAAAGPTTRRKAGLVALGSGLAAGMALLVRPSCMLFLPGALAVWVGASMRARRIGDAARGSVVWLLGAVLVMSPWWARNAQVYGRFVPTALWMGASLYDGLNPKATGASDMSFLNDPDVWPLDEEDQDARLTQRAVRFVRENPGRTLELAIAKLGRYWSPWPNAEGFSSFSVMVGGAVVELPLLGLMALGAWNRRRDLCVWVLSAGPILYFSAVHLFFASSMRYRIPAEMPALALAAFGGLTVWTWRSDTMRMGRRLAKLLFCLLALCIAIPAGGLWYTYSYMTDSATAARMIREYAVKYLRNSELIPSRVRLSPLVGDVVLHETMLWQNIDGVPFQSLRIPYLQVHFNVRKMAQGEIDLGEVHVSHPTLRLRRRRDGTWNLQGLLVYPWPGPWLEHSPPILIQNGTVELSADDEQPADSESKTSISSAADAGESTQAAGRVAGVPSLLRTLLPPRSPPLASGPGTPILRDLRLKIEQVGKYLYTFEGEGRGNGFDRIGIKGTFDLNTGCLELKGEMSGLTLSQALCRRVPCEARPALQALALNGGIVDIKLDHVRYNPKAPPGRQLAYGALIRLREGVWDCPKLPFQINDLSALVSLENDRLTIKHARGSNGQTSVRAQGTIALTGSKEMPLDLRLEVTDLELDDRLRRVTPAEYDDLWDCFKPRGRVDATLNVVRQAAGEPADFRVNVSCRDVAAEYRHFPYRLDHMTGGLCLEKNVLTVDLRTLTAPLVYVQGLIQNPGLDAIVQLDVQAASVPINDALRKAMPADVRKVIDQFHPSGLVTGHVIVRRKPMVGPDPRPEGLVTIDGNIDLLGQCEMTWVGLPYPVRDLTGRLELHPDRWLFRNIHGKNGQAEITASGSVHMLPLARLPSGEDPLEVSVSLSATGLPFNGELRQALPPAWKKTWATINPSGSCKVKAAVRHVSGHPDSTHIMIEPSPESNVRLQFYRSPQPGLDPGGPVELRMEDVAGMFDFVDGKVNMRDVNFQFRGEQVRFAHGTVVVEDTGRFALDVHDLWLRGIRFDADLRKKMPPFMSQFAVWLDDGKTFRARGDLQIGWSGVDQEPAWCRWDKTLVVFNGNSLKTGIPLEHIQGQIENVSGWSNGRVLEVQGILNLASVMFLGQQITQVESPFHVKDGTARLDSVSGRFLNGQLTGEGEVTLATTPHYRAAFSLEGAQLEEYARTISGRQSFRGLAIARIEVNGMGSDVHALSGRGEAHITHGDLGELPPVLKIAKAVNGFLYLDQPPASASRASGRTADFDSADVAFTISQGTTVFDLIKFTGNAFSLKGHGTMDPQANLDLKLDALWGRDRFHVPILSDVARQASTSFFVVRVQGTPSAPLFHPDPLPLINDALRNRQKNRARRLAQ